MGIHKINGLGKVNLFQSSGSNIITPLTLYRTKRYICTFSQSIPEAIVSLLSGGRADHSPYFKHGGIRDQLFSGIGSGGKAYFIVVGTNECSVLIRIDFTVSYNGRDTCTKSFFCYFRYRSRFKRGDNQDIHFLCDQLPNLFYLTVVVTIGILNQNLDAVIIRSFDTYVSDHLLPPGIVKHTLRDSYHIFLFLIDL